MNAPRTSTTWQAIRSEVMRRIAEREWAPGAQIPHEAELAQEFGCARATVNRALREVAEEGLVERRRRAGTRVALHPVRKATLRIPVIRTEIEARVAAYRFLLISRTEAAPPPPVAARFQADGAARLLHVVGLHLADDRPFVLEDRWIDPKAVPEVRGVDFEDTSPNEWLVENVTYQGGTIAFSAVAASAADARALDCAPGAALFTIDRATHKGDATLTQVRLTYAQGYSMETTL